MHPPRRLAVLLTLLLLSTRPVLAAEPAESSLAALLAGVAEALGGAERLAAVEGYRMEADVDGMGMQGRAVTWAAFPDRYRDEFQLGPLQMVLVVHGDQGWHRDHNGHVVALNEFELGIARTSSWVDAFRPWLDPPDPAVVSLADPSDVEGRTCPTVRVHPPGGNPAWIALDPERLLPVEARREDASGLGLDITRYGDYREVDGVLIPFLVESFHDGLPGNRTVYRVTAVVLGDTGVDDQYLPPEERPDVILPPGEDAVTMPLEVVSGHLFVEADLDGATATAHTRFLLDTGSTLSMLDAGLAASLGLIAEGDLSGHAIGGVTEVQLVEIPRLEVGRVQLLHQVVGSSVFADDISRQLGVPVAGILGYDFFSRFAVTLDFDGRTCTLTRPEAWSPPGEGVTLPLTFVDQQPVVEGTLDGDLVGVWRLDTGADGLTVHGPQAAAWALEQRHPGGRDLVASGLGGKTTVQLIRADSFQLGPYEIRQPLTLLSGADAGVLGADTIAGNIGNTVLDRFTVTVDFPGQRLHLIPGKAFARHDRVRTVDFVVGWAGTELRVLAVEPGGDGELSGLREGQRVLRIDGKPADRWSDDALTRLWSGEGKSSVVVVVWEEGPPRKRTRVRLSIPPSP